MSSTGRHRRIAFFRRLTTRFFPTNYHERRRFQWLVMTFATAVALMLGVWGYNTYDREYGQTPNWSNNIYHAFALLRLRVDERYAAQSPQPGAHILPLQLQVARLFVPAALFLFGLQALAAFVRSDFIRITARRKKGHIVVCGEGEEATAMMTNLLQEDYAVVTLWPKTALNKGRDNELEFMGVTIVGGTSTDESSLYRAGIRGAEALIALSPSDTENLETLLVARMCLKKAGRRSSDPLSGIARIARYSFFQQLQASDLPSQDDSLETIRVFGEAGAISRQIWQEMSWYRQFMLDQSDTFNAVIIGFGDLGMSLMERICCQSNLAGISKRRITVFDVDAAKIGEQFSKTARWVSDLNELSFEEIDVRKISPGYLTGILDQMRDKAPHCIYIAFNDDDLAIPCLLNFMQAVDGTAFARSHFMVRVSKRPKMTELLSRGLIHFDQFMNIHFFGGLNEIYHPDPLLTDKLDTLAKAFHEGYLGEFGESNMGQLESWDRLSELYKESNRQLADNIQNKLLSIGCRIVPPGESETPFFEPDKAELELLSRLEHERWVAERRAKGWVYAPRRSKALKHHPNIGSYEDLSETDREKDRAAVRRSIRLLQETGALVKKESLFCLLADESDGADALIDFVASRQEPDLHPVILTSLLSDSERRAMTHLKKSLNASLVIVTPLFQDDATFQAVPLPNMPEAVSLAMAAETILHVPVSRSDDLPASSDNALPREIRQQMREVLKVRLGCRVWTPS